MARRPRVYPPLLGVELIAGLSPIANAVLLWCHYGANRYGECGSFCGIGLTGAELERGLVELMQRQLVKVDEDGMLACGNTRRRVVTLLRWVEPAEVAS